MRSYLVFESICRLHPAPSHSTEPRTRPRAEYIYRLDAQSAPALPLEAPRSGSSLARQDQAKAQDRDPPSAKAVSWLVVVWLTSAGPPVVEPTRSPHQPLSSTILLRPSAARNFYCEGA